VVNQGDDSMSLVDPDAGIQIGKLKTNEVRAHEGTVSPDGRPRNLEGFLADFLGGLCGSSF